MAIVRRAAYSARSTSSYYHNSSKLACVLEFQRDGCAGFVSTERFRLSYVRFSKQASRAHIGTVTESQTRNSLTSLLLPYYCLTHKKAKFQGARILLCGALSRFISKSKVKESVYCSLKVCNRLRHTFVFEDRNQNDLP
jgi:hypothetical protein